PDDGDRLHHRVLLDPAVRDDFRPDPGTVLLPDDRARRDPAHARFSVMGAASLASLRGRRDLPRAHHPERRHLYRPRHSVLESERLARLLRSSEVPDTSRRPTP